jgi:hypothetical protein
VSRCNAEHGNKLWSVIPTKWQEWWMQEVRQCHSVYEAVTLQQPASVIADVTVPPLTDFETAIASNRAAEIRRACNEHLRPAIKCPWGCTEFYHKCRHISFDTFVRKWFGSGVLTTQQGPSYSHSFLNIYVPSDSDNAVHSGASVDWHHTAPYYCTLQV